MATAIVLDESTVLNYLESSAEFPVDFDSAWQWAGYTNKRNAGDKLKRHFLEGFDYVTIVSKTPTGGRPSTSYQLTNDCFKMFGMMAGTEKGHQIRRYYLNCEKSLKVKLATPPTQPVFAASPEERASMLVGVLDRLSMTEEPRYKQHVKDHVAKLIGLGTALPEAESKWHGVAEIAEQLGFSSYKVSKCRSGLGRVVASWYRGEIGSEPRTEERIVNGRMCDLKVYQRSEELDTMIAAYLEAKGLEVA